MRHTRQPACRATDGVGHAQPETGGGVLQLPTSAAARPTSRAPRRGRPWQPTAVSQSARADAIRVRVPLEALNGLEKGRLVACAARTRRPLLTSSRTCATWWRAAASSPKIFLRPRQARRLVTLSTPSCVSPSITGTVAARTTSSSPSVWTRDSSQRPRDQRPPRGERRRTPDGPLAWTNRRDAVRPAPRSSARRRLPRHPSRRDSPPARRRTRRAAARPRGRGRPAAILCGAPSTSTDRGVSVRCRWSLKRSSRLRSVSFSRRASLSRRTASAAAAPRRSGAAAS